jgi:hypothetical protein
MTRMSEAVGLLAGLAFFLGAVLAAQAYVAHSGWDLRADMVEALD